MAISFKSPLFGTKSISNTFINAFKNEVSFLAIDFANRIMLIRDNINYANIFLGLPDDKLTYTSPSAKLCLQADGNLAFQAHNLALWSEDISNAAWNKSNVTVSGNVATATGATSNKFIRQLNLVSGGPSYSIQFDVAAGTHSLVQIYTDTPTTAYANFDLANGVLGTVGATATATIEAIGGGVYRCTANFASTGTNARLSFIDSTSAAWNATSASTGTIIVTRAHFRRTPSVSDYIKATSAAVYRLPYVYSAGLCTGIMVEPAATNRNAYANAFGSWTLKSGVTVTADTTVAPDGTTTADTLAFTSSAYTYTINSTVTSTATLSMMGSIWLKGTPGDKIGLRIVNANTNAGDIIVVTLTADWVRYTVTASIPFTSGQTVTMGLETRVGVVPGTGTAVTFQAWGAQVEDGTVATSTIPTYGTAVLRAADPPEIATSLFPYNVSEGTLYIEATVPTIVGGSRVLSLNNNTTTIRVLDVYANSATTWTCYKTVDASVFTISSVAVAGNQKIAARYKQNDYHSAYNGTLGTPDTSTGAMETATMLEIGHQANASQMPMLVKRIAYFPKAKTNAELQELTA